MKPQCRSALSRGGKRHRNILCKTDRQLLTSSSGSQLYRTFTAEVTHAERVLACIRTGKKVYILLILPVVETAVVELITGKFPHEKEEKK